MDKDIYLKAISDAALHSGGPGAPLIFYTNGLIIVALLLVILWCRIRDNRKWQKLPFPSFCDDCLFLFHVKFGFCRKKCKYHPTHKVSATISYHQEKVS